MPILPLFPFRRRKKPVIYRMTCPKCGFDKEYELEKEDTIYNRAGNGSSGDPEIVKELPAICPNCGTKLKKTVIPLRIVY